MSAFQLMFDSVPADQNLIDVMGALEVEENADVPGAIRLSVPVNSDSSGDLTFVNDKRFQPFVNVAVVVTPDGKSTQCIFDGYILSSKLHLDRGSASATLQVWGQDASWKMNLEEKTREWVDKTDALVANQIFQNHQIKAADDNLREDSPSHPESGHSLMQRGSDIQFLSSVAKRTGKLCRVVCTDTPGVYTGYFAKPNVKGKPVITLDLNDPAQWTVAALDLSWDVTRPSKVQARQGSFIDKGPDGISGDETASGLDLLADRDLATFAGQTMSVMLTAPVDETEELQLRARSVLREAGWFARCEGEADASRLGAVLRVGTVVSVQHAGAMNSGKYFVWSVRHTIGKGSHRMKFVLVRNAVGTPPLSPAGDWRRSHD